MSTFGYFRSVSSILGYVWSAFEYIRFYIILVNIRSNMEYFGSALGHVGGTLVYVESTLGYGGSTLSILGVLLVMLGVLYHVLHL